MMPPGKKAIADKGYRGEPDTIAFKNENDSDALRKFKERVQTRHETVNAKIKSYRCFVEPFRHGVKKHKKVFEACCVLVQYELENGHPLFDA